MYTMVTYLAVAHVSKSYESSFFFTILLFITTSTLDVVWWRWKGEDNITNETFLFPNFIGLTVLHYYNIGRTINDVQKVIYAALVMFELFGVKSDNVFHQILLQFCLSSQIRFFANTSKKVVVLQWALFTATVGSEIYSTGTFPYYLVAFVSSIPWIFPLEEASGHILPYIFPVENAPIPQILIKPQETQDLLTFD